jgi:8-oxo-dGTP pyrophosphatase MutT (NUDIX family)
VSRDGVIEAAGGVVLRGEGDHAEVLVVHRVRYDDWSLPKGKLDPGERPEDAALREVEEETAVEAILGRPLPSVRYDTPRGPKRVRWYAMTPRAGDPGERVPDHEVDVARYVPVAEAKALLTYPDEVSLLRAALEGAVGGTTSVDDPVEGATS